MPAPDPAGASFPRWPDRSDKPAGEAAGGVSDSTVQFSAVGGLAEAAGGVSDSTVQFSAVGGLAEAAGGVSDSTVQFSAVGGLAEAAGGVSDSTVQFSAVGGLADAAGGVSDSTVQFSAVGGLADAAGGVSDSTVQFSAVGGLADAAREPLDMTMPFAAIGMMGDTTMPFLVVSPRDPGPAEVNGDRAEAELRSLIQSILAGLKPREREVIELSFRQAMDDDDLAIVLDVSWSRAHALAARARGRLEEALYALHILLTRRDACPVTGGVAGRLGWAADRSDVGTGQLAYPGLPDLRPSRMGRAAPGGVFPPAAVGPAPPGTSGAGPEPLYLPGGGCGGVSPAGRPARGSDMVRLALAGHKACELGQHPGSSWTGDRRRGCRSVGRGGGERYAAYLPWLPRCVCAGAPAEHGPCQAAPRPASGPRRGVPRAPRVQRPPRDRARRSRPRPLCSPRPPRRSRANRRIRLRRSPRPRPRIRRSRPRQSHRSRLRPPHRIRRHPRIRRRPRRHRRIRASPSSSPSPTA